jgi:hypothetical protein
VTAERRSYLPFCILRTLEWAGEPRRNWHHAWVAERVGASIRRAPYVWAGLTLLLFLLMLTPAGVLAVPKSGASQAVGIVAAGLITYCVVAWTFVLPRMKARPGKTLSSERSAMLLWSYACTPFLIGFGALAASGPQWALAVGFLTSSALIFSAVRRIRRGATAVS